MKTFQLDRKTGLLKIRRRRIARAGARSFAAAAPGPQLEDWNTPQSDIDTEIETGGAKMRNRARALEQDNAYFPEYLRELEANTIGDEGINLKVEGVTDADAETIENAWQEFGHKKNFSADRRSNRLDFGRMALRSIARDGDCMIEIHREFPKNRFGIAFRGFEGDFLDYSATDDARRIKMGVQTDAYGEPVFYHRHRSHPGSGKSYFGFTQGRGDLLAVAAETPGEINVGTTAIVPMIRRRFGQTRGYSWASAAIKLLRQLEKFEEAAVIKSRFRASIGGFFTHPEDDTEGHDTDENGNFVIDADPGSFQDIGRRTFTPFAPAGEDDYPGFRKGILRGVATALGISYNVLANDLEGVSFSSIRQGVLSERELWKILQRWYIAEVEGPLFNAWLFESYFAGALAISATPDQVKPLFAGRRWDWVDPQKDVNAAISAINANLSSTQRENRKRGQDPRRIAKEREEDAKLFGEEPAPAAPGAPAPDEDDDEPENVAPINEAAA